MILLEMLRAAAGMMRPRPQRLLCGEYDLEFCAIPLKAQSRAAEQPGPVSRA